MYAKYLRFSLRLSKSSRCRRVNRQLLDVWGQTQPFGSASACVLAVASGTLAPRDRGIYTAVPVPGFKKHRAGMSAVLHHFLKSGSLPGSVARFSGSATLGAPRCVCGFVGSRFASLERSFGLGRINLVIVGPGTLPSETAQALRGKRTRSAIRRATYIDVFGYFVASIIKACEVLPSRGVAVHTPYRKRPSCR